MSSSSDVSDSDSSERVLKEPDLSNVPYYFLKTGKSKSEGVLITHSDSFKFTKNNVNRNGTLHYYACSMKLTHKCPARAILRRTVELDENGEEVVLNELLEIATPEVSWILYSRMDCRSKFLKSVCFMLTEATDIKYFSTIQVIFTFSFLIIPFCASRGYKVTCL